MIISHFRDAFLHNHCVLCGDKSLNSSLICSPCWLDLITDQCACNRCGRGIFRAGLCLQCLRGRGAVDNTITLLSYHFPASQLLLSLKYKNQLLLADEFGRRLAEKILELDVALPDYIIPVPLHPARLFSRGYNQALEISRAISALLAVPVNYKIAKRIRNTLPQFNLSPGDRGRNIKGAFKINSPTITGKVAIVDDIVTTGHTANELAMQLKTAGATEVSLWACAYADQAKT